jgi:hypothetical protein
MNTTTINDQTTAGARRRVSRRYARAAALAAVLTTGGLLVGTPPVSADYRGDGYVTTARITCDSVPNWPGTGYINYQILSTNHLSQLKVQLDFYYRFAAGWQVVRTLHVPVYSGQTYPFPEGEYYIAAHYYYLNSRGQKVYVQSEWIGWYHVYGTNGTTSTCRL